MPLNKAKGRMFKSVGWTWNPAYGCNHSCPYKCWAREIVVEKWKKEWTPTFRERYMKDKFPDDGTWIFVCSMGDLFCSGMKDEWILQIIYKIKETKADNKFLFVTKNPFSYLAFGLELEDIKEKIILGTTIETNRPMSGRAPSAEKRYEDLKTMREAGFRTFLSMEPIADFDLEVIKEWIFQLQPEATEIGLESRTNVFKKPSDEKLLALISWLDEHGFPYMLKENLSRLSSLKETPK